MESDLLKAAIFCATCGVVHLELEASRNGWFVATYEDRCEHTDPGAWAVFGPDAVHCGSVRVVYFDKELHTYRDTGLAHLRTKWINGPARSGAEPLEVTMHENLRNV